MKKHRLAIYLLIGVVVCLELYFVLAQATLPSAIKVYDKGRLIKITLGDIEKYHGKLCPYAIVTFRATRLAISKLWDGIPQRQDFKVIASFPCKGSEDILEFVSRARMRGDFQSRKEKDYSFVIINKSTQTSVLVKLKTEADLFKSLREQKKIVSQEAKSKDRRQAFKKKMESLRKNCQRMKKMALRLPLDELIEIKLASDEN